VTESRGGPVEETSGCVSSVERIQYPVDLSFLRDSRDKIWEFYIEPHEVARREKC
jgi:hypothetical protein